MSNSSDTLNLDLSIRDYLFNILTTTYGIPIVSSVSKDDLSRDKWCYYFISPRPGKMGNPVCLTDLTYHIRAKHSATPGDTDGKWVTEIGNYVKDSIQKSDDRLWNGGDFPLLDFKNSIPEFILDQYRVNGDLSIISNHITSAASYPKLATFWLYEWSSSKTENLDFEGTKVFDYGINLVLMHYAPDILRN